jgi:hypothetical protein
MIDTEIYNKLRELSDLCRAEFNAGMEQLCMEFRADVAASDAPPGFVRAGMARTHRARVIAACVKAGDKFVASATEACGAEVGARVRIECNAMLAKVRAVRGAGDATVQ